MPNTKKSSTAPKRGRPPGSRNKRGQRKNNAKDNGDADTKGDSKSNADNTNDEKNNTAQQENTKASISWETAIVKAVADISGRSGSASAAVPLGEIYNSVRSSDVGRQFESKFFFRKIGEMLGSGQLEEVTASCQKSNKMKDAEGGEDLEREDSSDDGDKDDTTGSGKVSGKRNKDKIKGKRTNVRKKKDREKVDADSPTVMNKMIRIGPGSSLEIGRPHTKESNFEHLLAPEKTRKHKKTLIQQLEQEKKRLEEVKARIKDLESSMDDASGRVAETDRALEAAELNIPCKWNEMYRRLIEFHEKFGHCISVRQRAKDDEDRELATWCKEQRRIFARPFRRRRAKEENGGSGGNDDNDTSDAKIGVEGSSEERLFSNNDIDHALAPRQKIRKSLLDKIGFEWDAQEVNWLRFFHELLEHKAIHGNCNVSKTNNRGALAMWAAEQRSAYRARQMLEARKRAGNKGENHSNQETLECVGKESKALLIECGLGSSAQVKQCNKNQTVTPLSDEHFRLLNEAGFIFDRYSLVWDCRYEELLEYKEQHGDCLVPQKYPPNPPLGEWVGKQRSHYRKIEHEGEKNPLDPVRYPERLELLQKIGFVWEVKPLKPREGKKVKAKDSGDGGSIKPLGAEVALPTNAIPVPQIPDNQRGRKRKAEEPIADETNDMENMSGQNVNFLDHSTDHDWPQQSSYQYQNQEGPGDQQLQQQVEQQQQQAEQYLGRYQQFESLEQVIRNQNHLPYASDNAINSSTPAHPRHEWDYSDENIDNRFVASGMPTSLDLLHQAGVAYGTDNSFLSRQNDLNPSRQTGSHHENMDFGYMGGS